MALMHKKQAFAATAGAFIVIILAQNIGFASANPVPWPYEPNLERPITTIQSPQNNTIFAYNYTDAWLNFTVSTPDSWIIQHMVAIPIGEVDSVKAYLDGSCVYNGYTSEGYEVKLNLNQTTSGPHSLNV